MPSGDREPRVVLRGGLLPLREVGGQAARVVEHLPGLAGDVGPHVPGIGPVEQRGSHQLGHVLAPRVLRPGLGLDPRAAAAQQVVDHPDDQLALDLGAGRPVAEPRRALRPVEEQQVREARGGHAQVGADAVGPLLPHGDPAGAPDVDRRQPAGDRVEPGGQDQHVELHLAGRGPHPGGGDLLDRALPQVDEGDVVLVVGLVVVLLQRRALDAQRVDRDRRCQLLGDRRVVDPLPHLLPPELVGGVVGLAVEQHVLEGAEPEGEPAHAPDALVGGLALLGRDVQSRHGQEVVVEAAEGRGANGVAGRLAVLGLLLLLGGERLLAHPERQVRRALEDGELGRVAGRLLDDLHATGPGADHPDALAGEIDTGLWPQSGVVALTAEGLQPGDRRDVGLGAETGARHQEGGPHRRSVGGPHDPLLALLVELGRGDPGVEPDVLAQVELLVEVVEVPPDLAPVREPLGVLPVFPEVLPRELVHRPVAVDAGPRIAVPVPDAADPRAGLVDLHRVPERTQPVELVDAGESGADHEDVELLDRVRLGLTHACSPRDPGRSSPPRGRCGGPRHTARPHRATGTARKSVAQRDPRSAVDGHMSGVESV